jgi:hypothetical protein
MFNAFMLGWLAGLSAGLLWWAAWWVFVALIRTLQGGNVPEWDS